MLRGEGGGVGNNVNTKYINTTDKSEIKNGQLKHWY